MGIALVLSVLFLSILVAARPAYVGWRASKGMASVLFPVAGLAVLQCFTVPLGGVYPSLGLLLSLLLLLSLTRTDRLFREAWFVSAALLVVAHGISIMWSPSPALGFRYIIYLLPFFSIAITTARLVSENDTARDALLRTLFYAGLFQPVLVIAFRLFPQYELDFLSSALAKVFISPNSLSMLFFEGRNNVLDPAKSGGVLVNANIASCLMGIMALSAWQVGQALQDRKLLAAASIYWFAVFFTGSKAGTIAGLSIPLLALTITTCKTGKIAPQQLILSLLVAAALTPLVPHAMDALSDSGFGEASSSTLAVRQVIWGFAEREFLATPMLGHGFGGWEQRFIVYALSHGLSPGFPPHNALIMLWSQSGLFGALAGIVFAASILAWSFKHALANTPLVRRLGLAVFCGFVWNLFQAQGENFGLIGEVHITAVLAVLVGVLAGVSTKGGPPISPSQAPSKATKT